MLPALNSAPSVQSRAGRRHVLIAVVVGIVVGIHLLALGILVIIPAAWLAGGGDRLPRPQNPSRPEILYVVVGIGAIGAVLLVASLVVGLVLLLTGRNGTT